MSLPKYPAYKDSGCEWLGKVPERWLLKRVGVLFDQRREKVSDKEFSALSVTKNGVVPQLDTAAKTDDGDNRKLVRAGDFVINSRSDRKGSSGLSTLNGSVSLINTVLVARTEIEGDFAHHLFRSAPFQEEFYRNGKGIVADLWSTNFSEMKDIVLPVPTKSEQQAIAAFLDREIAKIDALASAQERLIELLKEKRQAVITHGVTQGLNPNSPMKDSGVEWLGRIPSHWDAVPIGHLCSALSYGFTNPMPSSEVGPHMLTANDIDYGRVRYETSRHTSAAAFENEITAKSRPEKDDLLLTKDGTLGRVAIHDGRPACINQSVAFLRLLHARISAKYAEMLLLTNVYQDHMTFEAGGTTIKHIYISRLAKMPIPVPPLSEQFSILSSLRSVTEQMEGLSTEAKRALDLLQQRRTALIAAAVTGQIDVRSESMRTAA